MTLKLYYDLMSQPSRALYIFLQVAKIPFESCPVALRNGMYKNTIVLHNSKYVL